ncbi:hypothetical protein SAY86_029992 [Trapa natans]|uniref:Uncharacterized protein n=1 Tax=Trapa natans TaxID=22666 RepID=A0AAN7M248_TRANT|nr:hypothetical protein SAY86_029992 [Trapa natans]
MLLLLYCDEKQMSLVQMAHRPHPVSLSDLLVNSLTMAAGRALASYHKRYAQEKSCLHIPCHCPLSYCFYIGSFKQVSSHFNLDHLDYGTTFKFIATKSIWIRFDTDFHVTMEEKGESLFLLHNRIDPLGNKMTVNFIGPPSKGDCLYHIVAKYDRSYLKLRTLTKSIQKVSHDLQVSPNLLIPKGSTFQHQWSWRF